MYIKISVVFLAAVILFSSFSVNASAIEKANNIEEGWFTFKTSEQNDEDNDKIKPNPDILPIIAPYILITVLLFLSFFSNFVEKVKKIPSKQTKFILINNQKFKPILFGNRPTTFLSVYLTKHIN